MARFLFQAESSGRPLKSCQVTVYTENAAVALGQEEQGFTDGDKASLFSDVDMGVALTNPAFTDTNGELLFYMPSGSQVAIRSYRSGYGTRWDRFVDITGSDP